MSSDNGIYILKTRKANGLHGPDPTKDVYEWRVADLQAIENLEEPPQFYDATNNTWTDLPSDEPELCPSCGQHLIESWQIVNARQMFAKAPVFDNEIEAVKYAMKLEKETDVLEYGISSIDISGRVF